MSSPLLGVVGHKDNGKTTLIERVIRELVAAGVSVSTIKHAHHDIDLDRPGKDTWRHRSAGATEVILATGGRWVLMRELAGEDPDPERLAERLAPVDLILVEGFRGSGHPKIEVHRRERGTPLLARTDPTVRAVASDEPLSDLSVPVLPLDDIAAVCAWILQTMGIARP